ncbi:hypothetical protein VNO77_19056 [Canavalia gladiata]|uniref:Uncharacterized protein n=1 Tax=Canavalia gladiata TaxID=3824 RepID=A0AAN9LM22_CANGL
MNLQDVDYSLDRSPDLQRRNGRKLQEKYSEAYQPPEDEKLGVAPELLSIHWDKEMTRVCLELAKTNRETDGVARLTDLGSYPKQGTVLRKILVHPPRPSERHVSAKSEGDDERPRQGAVYIVSKRRGKEGFPTLAVDVDGWKGRAPLTGRWSARNRADANEGRNVDRRAMRYAKAGYVRFRSHRHEVLGQRGEVWSLAQQRSFQWAKQHYARPRAHGGLLGDGSRVSFSTLKQRTYEGDTIHYLLHGYHRKHPRDGLRLVPLPYCNTYNIESVLELGEAHINPSNFSCTVWWRFIGLCKDREPKFRHEGEKEGTLCDHELSSSRRGGVYVLCLVQAKACVPNKGGDLHTKASIAPRQRSLPLVYKDVKSTHF